MPSLANPVAPLELDKDDIEPSLSEAKASSDRVQSPSPPLPPPSASSRPPQPSGACSASASGHSNPNANLARSCSPVNKLVSYLEDSPAVSAKTAGASLEELHAPQNIHQKNLNPPRGAESVFFWVNLDSDSPFDFVGNAKSYSQDQLNSAKWVFHEISDLKTKKLSLHSKLGEIEVKVAGLSQLEAEKHKNMKNIPQKDNTIENELEKIKGTLKKIAKQNSRIARHNYVIIKAMSERLEKTQKRALIVDLDQEKDQDEEAGISKHTRSSMKRKVQTTPSMAQIFMEGAQEMADLEEVADALLNSMN